MENQGCLVCADAHLPTESVLDNQEPDLPYQRKSRFNNISICLQLLSQVHCLPAAIFSPSEWWFVFFFGVIHNLSECM